MIWQFFFFFDIYLHIFQFYAINYEKKSGIYANLMKLKLTIFKTLFLSVIIADFVKFWLFYPEYSFRFSRPFRALMLYFYSNYLKKTV